MFLKRPLAGRPARIPLCQSSCRLDRAVPRFNLSRSTPRRVPAQSFASIPRARAGGPGAPLPLLGSCCLVRGIGKFCLSSGDCHGARPHRPASAARPCRRSDRISVLLLQRISPEMAQLGFTATSAFGPLSGAQRNAPIYGTRPNIQAAFVLMPGPTLNAASVFALSPWSVTPSARHGRC
jgi:hypothetical protein